MHDGISVRDARTFVILDANQRFCEIYGYSLEELRALPVGNLGPRESPDERRVRLLAHYGQVASDGMPRLNQWQATRKDGSTFWVEVHVKRITVEARPYLLSAVRDITEPRQAEEALKKSEARFRQLFDGVDADIVVRDAETFELLDANRKYCEMYGYTFEELKRLPLGSLSAGVKPDFLTHSRISCRNV